MRSHEINEINKEHVSAFIIAFVNIPVRCCFALAYLTLTCSSFWMMSYNQSSFTLCVLATCHIDAALPLITILVDVLADRKLRNLVVAALSMVLVHLFRGFCADRNSAGCPSCLLLRTPPPPPNKGRTLATQHPTSPILISRLDPKCRLHCNDIRLRRAVAARGLAPSR